MSTPALLQPGTLVVVNGLVSQAHLNGKQGTVKVWKENMLRYLVIMETGEKIACRPESLTLPGTPPAPATSSTGFQPPVDPYSDRERCSLCQNPLRLDHTFQHPLVCCGGIMCQNCFKKDMVVTSMECPHCQVVRPPSTAKEYVEMVLQRTEGEEEENSSWAHALMAEVYINGHPGYKVERDVNKSRSYLERAVELGHTTAMCMLGHFYLQAPEAGMGVERNPLKAYALFKQAAEKGCAPAIFNMGQMHERGDGVTQSWQEAIDFYTSAAQADCPPACFRLGMLCAKGEVMEQNLDRAKVLWTTGAKIGHKDCIGALKALEQMVQNNTKGSVQVRVPPPATTGGITTIDKLKNVSTADLMSTEEKCSACDDFLAIDSARWQPNACCNTKCCMGCVIKFARAQKTDCNHCHVDKLMKNSPEYLQLVQRRAEEDQAGWAIAAMAEVYMFGHPSKLVDVDNDKAREHLERATEAGHTVSMTNLGAFYMDGTKGVEQDYVKAHGLYVKAARAGNFAAVYNLGQMHERGDGVQQDWQEAINLFNMAASKGYAPAQFALGLIFVKGEVVEQNFPLARQVWTAAAQQGFPAAIQGLKQLDQVEAQQEAAKAAAAKAATTPEGIAAAAAQQVQAALVQEDVQQLEAMD